MSVQYLSNLEQLTADGSRWDALWACSEMAFPSTQAALISQWMSHFAPNRDLAAIVLEQKGQWQAALPLVHRRQCGLVKIAELPGNEWSPIGNFLVDPDSDSKSVRELVDALDQTSCSLFRLGPVRLDAPQWRRFIAELERRTWPIDVEQQFFVGQVTVEGDWDTYFASRSRNLRKDLGKARRRLEASHNLTARIYFDPDDQHLSSLMQRGFAVEDRSWKGQYGTSVLKTPGLLDFYIRQARLLRDRNQLQISLLELDGEPIAFEYGWRSHQTYYSFKVGYDATYGRNSPGQLLRMKVLEHLFADEEIRYVDFFGPINRALAAWATKAFPVGRLVGGKPTLAGRLLVAATRGGRRWTRRVRGHAEPVGEIRPYEPQTPDTVAADLHRVESLA